MGKSDKMKRATITQLGEWETEDLHVAGSSPAGCIPCGRNLVLSGGAKVASCINERDLGWVHG
jgi:hypothetical protein